MEPFSVKIKCGACNKNKSRELFSGNALKRYNDSKRVHARSPKEPVKPILCLACNHVNRDELFCAGCRTTMALERFNKTQRRRGDDALCLDCSQERQDMEVNHDDEVREIVIIDQIKKSELGYHAPTSSKLGSAVSRSMSGNDRFETDTNPSSLYYVEGNDAVSLAGTTTSVASSTNTRPTTGTHWDAYPGIQHRSSGAGSGSSAGFAKQGAVKQDPRVKAMQTYEREQRVAGNQDQVVRDESDDSEDDDDDVPY